MISLWKGSPLRLLFSWARWLRVQHPTVSFVNRWIPIIGFAVALVFGALVPGINITRELGLVQQVNGLLQMLAPFFVAALALVAAFPGQALDLHMGGLQPSLRMGGEEYRPTRREILGYLFAYLAGLSVIVYLVGGFVVSLCNPTPQVFIRVLNNHLHGWIPYLLKGLYGAVLLHLFATTMLGLHFLGNFLSASQITRAPNPVPPPPVEPQVVLATPARARSAPRAAPGQTQARSRGRG